ncbi:MAG: hypothetical protein JNM27_19155 [Leptospirales bacterium]|nr:hypothetical protein [Leptospirales bacterium]
MKTKLVLMLMIALVSCSGGKKKGMLLFPLSMGDASASSETATAGDATVTDTSQESSTGTVDSTLANVAVGESDVESIVNPPAASTTPTTSTDSTSPSTSTATSDSTAPTTGSTTTTTPAASPATTPAETSPSTSVAPSTPSTSPAAPAATPAAPATPAEVWPGETADEAETSDDPYLPVSEICQGSPTFQGVEKVKSNNGKGDDKGKSSGKSDDKDEKGKSDEHTKSVSLGDYDLSMDAANCQTGRFRIALDFNITGTLPAKTTSFHVLILDLNGKTIGKVNIQAKEAGIIKARGKITLSEVGQTILFRWDGASDEREKAVSAVAANVEITGITLYAKKSQKATKLASMVAMAGGKTPLMIGSTAALAILALGVYAIAESRKRKNTVA